MPTFGSLFSGIGGLDLGLERAGWECRWQVEKDEWCSQVLARHWPDVPRFGDVQDVTGDELEPVDLICGGFPCQSVSVAGRRRGREDDRWLWPEFARLVRRLRPRLVLVENVPGLLAPTRVEDAEGAVLGYVAAPVEDVLGDLAAIGYDAEWDCIPAAAVGAPHLRYRIFLVAHADPRELRLQPAGLAGSRGAAELADDGGEEPLADAARDERRSEPGLRRSRIGTLDGGAGSGGTERLGADEAHVADAHGGRQQELGEPEPRREQGARRRLADGHGRGATRELGDAAAAADAERDRLERFFQGGPASGPALGDGRWWATEPDVGRVAHGVPARVDRLRGLGNAVVPQVAEWIGRRLMEVA